MKISILFIFTLVSSILIGQCVSNVDLNTWSQKGPTSAGTWAVSGGGTSVYQSINGAPTFFVNPQDLINVEITGQFGVRAGAGDNDMIGFVIGYQEPSGTAGNYDFLLCDWNKELDAGKPYYVALSKVKGTSGQCNLWTKVGTAPGIVTNLQNSTYTPWVEGATNNFSCLYTSSRILVKLNGTVVIDVPGCFEPGKFGFYNMSQGKVDYSNFSYRSVTDFSIANDSVCFDNNTIQGDVDLDIFCYGNNISNPYNTIRWDMGDGTIITNSTTLSHSYSAPGVYNIELYTQDLAGCEDSLTKTITVLDPNISVGPDIDSCTNGNVSISSSTSSPNITTYLWSNGQTSSSINPNLSGEYHIEATDDAGCKAYDTMNLVLFEVPQVSISATNSCLNNQVTITDNSSISSGNITNWVWDFGDGNSFNTQNPIHSYSNDGTYNVQLTVTSNNNCTNTQNVSYSIYPLPVNNAGADITLNCQTTSATFMAPGGDSYSWETPDGIVNTANVPVSLSNLIGNYILTATTANNCILKDTAIFSIDTIVPLVNAGADSILLCKQLTMDLNGSGTSTGNNMIYLWNSPLGNIVSGNTILSPTINKNGVYYLTVSNTINFCTATDSVKILIDTIVPISEAGLDSIVTCLIPEIELNGVGSSNGNYSYNWTTTEGIIISDTTTLTPLIGLGGYYYLTVTNNYSGCFAVDSVHINEDITANVDILSSSFSTDTVIGEPPLAIDYSWFGDAGVVSWDLGDNNFTTDSSFMHTYNLRGEYDAVIKLTDINGCIAFDSLKILILSRDIIFPNVFTPNGDGENDIFSFRGEKIKEFECSIFNRWGQIIYSWNTPVGGWDGRTLAGNKQPEGQYFYILKAIDNTGLTIEKKGTIMLMR